MNILGAQTSLTLPNVCSFEHVNTQALTKFMTQLTMPNMSKSMNTRTLNGDSQNVCIIDVKLSNTFQHKSVAKATQ